MKYCECDIAMTSDEAIVLAHDKSMGRLALLPEDPNSFRLVSELVRLRASDSSTNNSSREVGDV